MANSGRRLVLVKHATPVLDPAVPARDWVLSAAGEAEAAALADRLRELLPCRVVSSPEPKAKHTAAIVAERLGLSMTAREGLHEIDRPVLPIMTPEAHRQANAAIFSSPDRPALGTESARQAVRRFGAAIRAELAAGGPEHVVVVTHGTVIALFVSDHNDLDAFELWASLACASFVVLDAVSFRLSRASSALAGLAGARSPGAAE